VADPNLRKLTLVVFVLIVMGTQFAFSQCPITVTLGNATVEPCSLQRISIPVYMNNTCGVGGFEFRICTTQRAWLTFQPGDPQAADTIGSRISNWRMFSANVHAGADSQIIVTGIATMPPDTHTVFLPPGDGLIFTIHMNYNNNLICDSSQALAFTRGNVSDPSGNILYDSVTLNTDYVYVLAGRCGNNPRGDINCSGQFNGLDVTYLVAYLKGLGPGFCCLCSGDANHSGSVNGIDVTYMVGYFKGFNPPPDPCN
jgi:hypothetical protein